MQQPPNQYTQYPQQQYPQQWQQTPIPQQQWNPPQQWNPQQPIPPQQWYEQPPQYQPPKKKSHKGLFIILGVILALVLFSSIGFAALVNAGGHATQQALNQTSTQVAQQPTTQPTTQLTTQPTTQPTTQSTQSTSQAKWTTVQTITGNGSKKTAIFTAPNDWKIVWSCNPSSFFGGQYNLQVVVTGSDDSVLDIPINTICKTGNTSDSTEEHQGGQVYLDVISEGAWTIQVQELK